jgi:hypothetical protein
MFANVRLIVLFVFCLVAAALAADTATPPGRAALLPIVEVTKVDNTVLRARLVESDGVAMVLQPMAANSEKITLTWREIKRVNTGLTQQKAAEAWKTAHRAELCEECKGERLLVCATCKGTARDLAARAECKSCKGAGQTKCAAAKCNAGQIPCPGPCIKLNVGNWVTRNGDRRIEFPMGGGGVFWLHEPHAGEVVEMKNGLATGKTSTCSVCNHKATIDCLVCHGTAQEACKECINSATAACPDACENGMAKCKKCEGTGLVKKAVP